MKRNRLFSVLLIVMLVAAFMAVAPVFAQSEQPPAVPQSAVELPIELQALLAAGIGFLVTAGLKSLSTLLKSDISGWASVITASLVTSIVYFFNALLSTVPPSAQQSVAIGFMLLISILSAFGVARTAKKLQPKQAE